MIHADILGERSRLTPGKTALVYVPTQECLTYAQLNAGAAACARIWIDALGIRKGDRVGILAHNRIEFFDAFFAAGKSGIILVPLPVRSTPRELEFMVRDSGLSCLMYDGGLEPTVADLKKLVSIHHWVAFDDRYSPEDHDYASLKAKAGPHAGVFPRHDPEDIYCILYTSGTTGKPKGVMLPHRMIAWNGYNTAICWGLSEDDVSPVFTPLYHAGGFGVFVVPLFIAGGTIVLHRGFDAPEIWRTVESEGCSVVFGVPTVFKMLMEAGEFHTVGTARIRWFVSGGAPLPRYVIQAYQERGIILKQGYGLTEVGVNCFSMTVEEAHSKAGSIGKPLMFTEARLVDASGTDVASGEAGELLLRGPHVCTGYWNNLEATARAIDGDGWFHTEDLARRDGDGFYYITGRKKDMFISGGVNVYPAEIEAELLGHPGVSDAAVIGIPHEKWGEVGVAFVVPREAGSLTAEQMTAHLSTRLARHKLPREYVFLESLPRTPYGKVLKSALKR